MATLRELEAQETSLAYPALLELRPHLGSLDACVQQVNQEQRAEGYRLVGAFEDGIKDAVAVAGFRTLHTLAWGSSIWSSNMPEMSSALPKRIMLSRIQMPQCC